MMNISTFINMASKIPSPGQLEGLVTFMKEDEKLRFFTESYRKTGNKSYKHDAPLFAVACIFEGGKGKDNIRSLTHLSLVDFDHITEKPDDGTLRSLKERICHDAHTLLCYVTMSGNGASHRQGKRSALQEHHKAQRTRLRPRSLFQS